MEYKNVLFGNGVNVEFSDNNDYKNYSIIERMMKNMSEQGRYTDVFAGKVDADDLADFLPNLNKWFKQYALVGIDALRLVANKDELTAFLDMSRRYKDSDPDVIDIGLEDYLMAVKLFNATFGEVAVDYELLYQSITKLMLDAIYNDGQIEELWRKMNCFTEELDKYSEIFTVNYDRNIDKIAGKRVHHLHGAFDTLHHEYREDTLKGYAIKCVGKKVQPYIKGKEFLYCDAVFGYSGQNKLSRMNEYNAPYNDPGLESVRKRHPELLCPAYPLDAFKAIHGELHIIGLSPNNDSHIFQMINDNPNISKVVFYSANDEDTEKIKRIIIKPLEVTDVFAYWKIVRNKTVADLK